MGSMVELLKEEMSMGRAVKTYERRLKFVRMGMPSNYNLSAAMISRLKL